MKITIVKDFPTMLKPEELEKIIKKIRFFEEEPFFIHPDEMAGLTDAIAKLPGVSTETIGTSREARSIYLITIGTGEKRIVAVAGAHADEPTGTITLLHLAGEISRLQAEGDLSEYRFYLIPQLDPDGAAANWEWMKAPYSYVNYVRHAYRQNDPEKDVENGIAWLPEQTMRPEVSAIKECLDRISHIDCYISFHTTHVLGGALFILGSTNNVLYQPIIEFLTEKCQRSGLQMCDEDIHGQYGICRVAPGFLSKSTIEEIHNLYRHDPVMVKRRKMATLEYAERKCNARLVVVSELPFIIDPELNNQEETVISLYDYNLETIRRSEKNLKKLLDTWSALSEFPVSPRGKFWREYYEFMFDRIPRDTKALRMDLDRYKSEAARMRHLYSLYLSKFYEECAIPLMGMRRLEGLEIEDARSLFEAYEHLFEKSFQEYEKRMTYRVLPLSAQVQLQAAMLLAATLVN